MRKFKVGQKVKTKINRDRGGVPLDQFLIVSEITEIDKVHNHYKLSNNWWYRDDQLIDLHSGTAIIRRTRNGGYRSTLVGKNGEVMFTSEVYTTKAMCKKILKLFPDFEVVDKTLK